MEFTKTQRGFCKIEVTDTRGCICFHNLINENMKAIDEREQSGEQTWCPGIP
jgi:hypothetical protein